MKIENIPFHLINWDEVEVVEVPGLTGTAMSKIWELGNIRVRLVQYLPEYQANHWNHRGQVVLVLAGQLKIIFPDDRVVTVQAGETFVVGDNTEAHKIMATDGATVFMVD